MANDTKARAIQLIKTEDHEDGSTVRFFDRRNGAFIGAIDVAKMKDAARNRAARHGVTQNVLDSSNKLSGDERVAFIKAACATVQSGGWSSAPVDEEALRQRTIDALVKLGYTAEAATAIANGQAKM